MPTENAPRFRLNLSPAPDGPKAQRATKANPGRKPWDRTPRQQYSLAQRDRGASVPLGGATSRRQRPTPFDPLRMPASPPPLPLASFRNFRSVHRRQSNSPAIALPDKRQLSAPSPRSSKARPASRHPERTQPPRPTPIPAPRQDRSRNLQISCHPATIPDSALYERAHAAPPAPSFEFHPANRIIRTPGRTASSPPRRARRAKRASLTTEQPAAWHPQMAPLPCGTARRGPEKRYGSATKAEAGLSGWDPDNPDNPRVPISTVTFCIIITYGVSKVFPENCVFSRTRTNAESGILSPEPFCVELVSPIDDPAEWLVRIDNPERPTASEESDMYCSSCGVQLEDQFAFCHNCGRPTRDRTSPWGVPAAPARPLWEKKIGGVCAGFARYFAVDVSLMRIICW